MTLVKVIAVSNKLFVRYEQKDTRRTTME